MRKILLCLCLLLVLCFSAQAQHTYIESDSITIIKDGDIAKYDSPNLILVGMRYKAFEATWVATIGVAGTGATTDFAANLDIEFAQADVDALTGSGATETRVIANALLQIIVDYLEAIPDNIHANFTLN